MHGALEARDEMVRIKERENAQLKDRIKVLEKQLSTHKQSQANQRDLHHLQALVNQKDVIIKQLQVRLEFSEEAFRAFESQGTKTSSQLGTYRYKIKKSVPTGVTTRMSASNLRPSMNSLEPLQGGLSKTSKHNEANTSPTKNLSGFAASGRVTIGRADTVAEMHAVTDSPHKESHFAPDHKRTMKQQTTKTFLPQNTKVSLPSEHLLPSTARKPLGTRQSTMLASPSERSNPLARKSMIELVTSSQGLKRVETIFNTNYGAKPLITMSSLMRLRLQANKRSRTASTRLNS